MVAHRAPGDAARAGEVRATMPPSVAGARSVPKIARVSGGSAISMLAVLGERASISGMGVPARAEMTSSAGDTA
jgi:hypothetical protein